MVCNFYNKSKSKTPFNQAFVEKNISRAAAELKIFKDFELTVLLVGDKKIRSLNKKYKNKDKITDVLAFSQKEGQELILPETENNYLGDIFICYPQAKRQAKNYGQSLKREFSLLLIHGFLHLLGYGDEKKADYLKMKKLQDKIMNKIYG